MDFKRSATVIISILILSTVLYAVEKVTSPFSSSDIDDIEGDWYLTYTREYDSDGNGAEGTEGLQFDLSVSSTENGVLKGTLNGTDFVGALYDHFIRFQIVAPTYSLQAIGKVTTSSILNLSIMLSDATGSGAYSLLFTRDNVLPSMIEFISYDVTGDWICNGIKGADPGFQEISINVISQNISVCHGTMDRDGTVLKFSAVIAMMGNDNMNIGLLMDENGEYWIMSAKKGLIALYSASASAGTAENTRIDMVRDKGSTYVPVPEDVHGKTWTGTTGYDINGTASEITNIKAEVSEQNETLIRGKMTINGTEYEFAGMFVMTSSSAAELRIAGTGEIHAMLFMQNEGMRIIMFGEETLPDGYAAMEFR